MVKANAAAVDLVRFLATHVTVRLGFGSRNDHIPRGVNIEHEWAIDTRWGWWRLRGSASLASLPAVFLFGFIRFQVT
jgi:hypothetical protein